MVGELKRYMSLNNHPKNHGFSGVFESFIFSNPIFLNNHNFHGSNDAEVKQESIRTLEWIILEAHSAQVILKITAREEAGHTEAISVVQDTLFFWAQWPVINI